MYPLRALLLLAAALAQMIFAFTPDLFGIEGSIGETASRYDSPLVPAGWAFSIWLLLYAGGVYVAVWHLFRPGRAVVAQVGWLATVAFSGNAVWALHQPAFGPGLVSFALLEVVLLFSFLAGLTGQREDAPSLADRLAHAALFALAGWITVATPAGMSLALMVEGILSESPKLSDVLPILLVWAPVLWALAYRARAIAFVLPVLWGLYGVTEANPEDTQLLYGLAVVGGVSVLLAITAKLRAR